MSRRVFSTLSDELYEAAEILRFRRKYRDLPEVIRSHFRYDCLTQREHHLTNDWAAMSPDEQDLLDKSILQKVKDAAPVRGSWLEATIEDCVRRVLAEGRYPETEEIARGVARAIATERPRIAPEKR